MKKLLIRSVLTIYPFLLSGGGAQEAKSANLSIVYCATALLASLLLVAYCCFVKKKDPWFLLLFASAMVVNIGYFALSTSKDLAEALLANRLSYLGSVFLPISVLMIILNVSRLSYKKWVPPLLIALGAVMFFIAASPGYLPIYYKEVYYQQVNGVAVLQKVYGPLHWLYLVYLLGSFTAMVVTIIHATVNDTIESTGYAAILAIAVFVNIGVWLIEQLVHIDFEFLSVSYIISECFLLGLHLFMAEVERQRQALSQTPSSPETPVLSPAHEQPSPDKEALEMFVAGLSMLTRKERTIYDMYVEGLSTTQVLEKLEITENTLKFHNKNIYSKLGISSRKQLLRLAALKSRPEKD